MSPALLRQENARLSALVERQQARLLALETGFVWMVTRDDGERWWVLIGVFSREEDAVAACRDETYFVARIPMNTRFPHEAEEIPSEPDAHGVYGYRPKGASHGS